MKRPILLDTFCCGGGASRGYDLAGFEVYGIDNDPKRLRDYPYPYLVADAMECLIRLQQGEGLTFSDGRTLYLSNLAAIHGSPPCQGYSIMNNLPWIRSRTYPLLILPLRELLEEIGKPYIIENVAGAASKRNLEKLGLLEHRLRAFWLCGGMFGLPIYRHRYFETNFFWAMPGHPKHTRVIHAGRMLGGRANVDSGIVADVYGAGTTPGQRGMHGAHGGDRRRRPHLTERAIGTNGKDYKPHGEASLHRSLHMTTPATTGNGAQAVGAGVGHAAGWKVAAEAMGIDWMRRSELTQAIPPVMTEYIGKQLLAVIV